jgi:NADH-quinone oxidoreductase subunit G
MIHLTVDGREVEVPEGTLILDAAKEVGADVPTFCYHHLMKPVAACRMCLVEVEKRPKLEPACAVTVTEGMVVHTQSERVLAARHGVLEFLLAQHPLDCPVCDKGGECDLQDNTMNHGRFRSRYEDPKIKKHKRLPLSDLVVLDEERCIVCQRCVRFMEEIVEDPQLALRQRGAYTAVSVFPGRPFTSPFSGNTIEMCPVGALTSRPYRFRARPWDNRTADTICTHCPVGCNLAAQERDGEMVRVLSRENLEVDGGWLCDRGRFGYRWVHHRRRLDVPVLHQRAGGRERDAQETPLTWAEALTRARDALFAAGARTAILGGGRLTAEGQMAARRLADRLGTHLVDHRTGAQRWATAPTRRARIADLDAADRILLLGVVPVEEVPVIDLRIKAAVRRGARLAVVGERRALADQAAATAICRPGGLGATISRLADTLRQGGDLPAGAVAAGGGIDDVAAVLAGGERIVALWSGESGAGPLARLAEVLGDRLVGTLVTGGAPQAQGAERAGLNEARTRDILEAAARGEVEAVVVLDDLFADAVDADLAARALERAPFVLSLAHLPTEAAARADLVLPLAAPIETDGHVVNLEGRVQSLTALLPPPGEARPDWWVLSELAGEAVDASELLAAYEARPEPAPPVADADADASEGAAAAYEPGTLVAVSGRILFDSSVRWEEGLRSRLPVPFVGVHHDLLQRLGLAEGSVVRLGAPGFEGEVEVRADASLPPGTVFVPRGVIGLPADRLHGVAVTLEATRTVAAKEA